VRRVHSTHRVVHGLSLRSGAVGAETTAHPGSFFGGVSSRGRCRRLRRGNRAAARAAQKVRLSTTILMPTVIAADRSAEIAIRMNVSRQVIRAT
jgi:hypothetical protein